jgi:hypothetical protein
MEEPSDGPYFREQAGKCRSLAASVTDEGTRNALLNLAADYEEKATIADRKTKRIIVPKPILES